MDQRFEHSARERRDHIGSVLRKSDASDAVDMHSNAQEMHPIDVLANAVETYGIAYLLSVLKKGIYRNWWTVCTLLGATNRPANAT